MTDYRKKIMPLEKMKSVCDGLKKEGKRIVFTNGCFDILHPGHTRYLQAAKALGDFLVVAVNSDRSVRSIKTPDRPVTPEQDRAELLAALGCVDGVVLFDQEDPLEVISRLVPHVLVKGGDWAEDAIIGGELVKNAGGEVRRIPFEPGYSTTDIIRKIKNAPSKS